MQAYGLHSKVDPKISTGKKRGGIPPIAVRKRRVAPAVTAKHVGAEDGCQAGKVFGSDSHGARVAVRGLTLSQVNHNVLNELPGDVRDALLHGLPGSRDAFMRRAELGGPKDGGPRLIHVSKVRCT
jgi:hypothetical protein